MRNYITNNSISALSFHNVIGNDGFAIDIILNKNNSVDLLNDCLINKRGQNYVAGFVSYAQFTFSVPGRNP